MIEDGEKVSKARQAVKLGTSLALLFLITWTIMKLFSSESTDKLNASQLSSQSPSKSTSQKVKEEKIHSNQNKTDKECLQLRKNLEAQIKTRKISKSWSNTFLEKDGEEYVLRIERDSNNQGLEIQRIKFYKLDEDGFPTPYSSHHDSVLSDSKQLEKLKEGFNHIQTNDVFLDGDHLIETKNGEIQKVSNQASQASCYFN